ncbi:MAG: TIGR01777 family oxidoreductase [Acidimicrobiales bacterium]|nr:TIGR01777 family oxidoreductase [Acidimicrobiales bacterium]
MGPPTVTSDERPAVLVAGASGLIGGALVDRLTRDGRRVLRLQRPETGSASSTPPPRAVTVPFDPGAGHPSTAALEGLGPIDAVVNLAGAGIGDRRWSPSRKQALRASRLVTTDAIVDLAGRCDPLPRVLVNASAVGVYGDRGQEVLTETSAAGSGFLAELCRDWEASASRATDLGLRTVLLRSGIVLAPRGGALGRQVPLFRLGLGGRLGPGTQYRSWISLEDEVAVIVRCLDDDGFAGPVNATGPDPVTDADFAVALGRALRRPARLAVPAAALRVALGREMADEMLLSGQRVEPALLRSRGFEFAHPTLDAALSWVLPTGR